MKDKPSPPRIDASLYRAQHRVGPATREQGEWRFEIQWDDGSTANFSFKGTYAAACLRATSKARLDRRQAVTIILLP
jgi:hypothetical protein